MITVACVLRSGGAYDAGYVARLKDGVSQHLAAQYRFVCLSDVSVPCERIPLEHDWPGWWAKICLFEPGLFDSRVLYLDLDTALVGSLDDLAAFTGSFAMIDDWNHEWLGASGVMLWEPSPATERIYEDFAKNPSGVMDSFRGDQNYISQCLGWVPLRQHYPGQIVSRWYECIDGVPPDARVICFHGTPKPHEINWSLEGHHPQRTYSWGPRAK